MLSIANHHPWPCSLVGVMWGRRASIKLVLNCKADKEGGEIKQLLLQKQFPLMGQVRQPLLHHFGFGFLLLVVAYLIHQPSHKSQDSTPRTLLKGYQCCNMSGFRVLSTFWSITTTNSWKAWANMQWSKGTLL